MRVTPAERARELVAGIAPEWARITSGDINLRRELLDALCFDFDLRGERSLKAGLPGLYLVRCAQSGDKAAFDLLAEAGTQLDSDRPKTPGGVDRNSARDFVVHLMATVLMMEAPQLCLSANNATAEGISAVDMVRKALEDAGLGCVDYRSPIGDEPVPRSMERAVKRFRKKSKYRELFWPEIDDAEESCHTPILSCPPTGVCAATPGHGGTNDGTGTTALGRAAHDYVALAPLCTDESGGLP